MSKKPFEVYLTVDEVAESLKFHPYTVRRLCREGEIPCYRFGGRWRFSKDELEQWAKKRNKK